MDLSVGIGNELGFVLIWLFQDLSIPKEFLRIHWPLGYELGRNVYTDCTNLAEFQSLCLHDSLNQRGDDYRAG